MNGPPTTLHPGIAISLQVIGVLITWAVLIDVFLTVLYARFGSSLFAQWVGRFVWSTLKALARLLPLQARGKLLSFGGPLMIAVLATVWASGLSLGAGLLLYPEMGHGIRATSGETPTDLISATWAGANSMAIAGSGQFSPHTRWLEMVYMFNSLVGLSMLPLVMTYFLQVFSALQHRNTVALRLHLATLETGDAAYLLASLLHAGGTVETSTRLRDMASAAAAVREAAHFYSMLIYFRFTDPLYAVSRLALVQLDTAALVQTALDEEHCELLRESDGASVLSRAAMHLARGFGDAIHHTTAHRGVVTDAARDSWRRRYFSAIGILRDYGVPVTADLESGANRYVILRELWDPLITGSAHHMGYTLEEIDVAERCPAPLPPAAVTPPAPSAPTPPSDPPSPVSPRHTSPAIP